MDEIIDYNSMEFRDLQQEFKRRGMNSFGKSAEAMRAILNGETQTSIDDEEIVEIKSTDEEDRGDIKDQEKDGEENKEEIVHSLIIRDVLEVINKGDIVIEFADNPQRLLENIDTADFNYQLKNITRHDGFENPDVLILRCNGEEFKVKYFFDKILPLLKDGGRLVLMDYPHEYNTSKSNWPIRYYGDYTTAPWELVTSGDDYIIRKKTKVSGVFTFSLPKPGVMEGSI